MKRWGTKRGEGRGKGEGFRGVEGRCTQIVEDVEVWVPAKLSWETWSKERKSGRSFCSSDTGCHGAKTPQDEPPTACPYAYLPPPMPVL